MLYRPNFCSNCGDKIERTEWSFLTSRRFCEVCSSDLQFKDLVLKIAVVLFGLVALAAISSIFRPSGPSARTFADTAAAKSERGPQKPATNLNATPAVPPQSQTAANEIRASDDSTNVIASTRSTSEKTAETVYFCGAATKKGTPCSRRVKHSGDRCWQHIGMPSMLETKASSKR
jgi:hypothetical protein